MGLTVWQAERAGICAGWTEAEGRVLALAPILRRWHRPGRSLAETLRRAGFVVVLVWRGAR